MFSERFAALEGRLSDLVERAASAERRALQLKYTMRLDEKQQEDLAGLDRLLDERRIIAHIRQAIAATPIETDPYPHIVVDKLFPEDFYKLLRKAIPPPAFFGDRDPIKQNLRLPMSFGPKLSVRVMNFLEEVVASQAICPAVIEKFDELLQPHYDSLFGSERRERARRLSQSISNGRVMLRRPGYHLAPHRDPKRSMITCLLYFAGTKDSEEYGTHIYRVADDRESSFAQTYYPEESGSRCELVKTVPYRSNTMLVFLNATGGAHGASIPVDASAALERYSYQFYIGPVGDEFTALIADLPPERQALWRSIKDAAETVDY